MRVHGTVKGIYLMKEMASATSMTKRICSGTDALAKWDSQSRMSLMCPVAALVGLEAMKANYVAKKWENIKV